MNEESEVLEQQEMDIARGLINSTRRWDTTPKIRRRLLKRAYLLAHKAREEKTQLKAVQLVVAMEAQNQRDEIKAAQRESESQRGPSVTFTLPVNVNVDRDAITAILSDRRELIERTQPEVIENSPPTEPTP